MNEHVTRLIDAQSGTVHGVPALFAVTVGCKLESALQTDLLKV
jgi:hypothetical protein